MPSQTAPSSTTLVVIAIVLVAGGLVLLFTFGGGRQPEAGSTQALPGTTLPTPAPRAQREQLPGTAADEPDLHTAAAAGDVRQLQRLLEDATVDVDEPAAGGRTPLMLAAEEGHVDAIRVLLSSGADVHAADEAGLTGLMLASAQGDHRYPEAAIVLLEAGARLEAADADGRTALSWAAERAGPEMVITLLNAGADPRSRDGAGRTPADHARARPTSEEGAQVAAILAQAG